MAKISVLLLGATGETGRSILEGLLEDGSYDVACLVQPSSADKPSVQALKDRGLEIVIADLTGSVDELAQSLKGYDIVISTIGPAEQSLQLSLVDAAAKAQVKRFVPCAWITVCPPGGTMTLRDKKEEVYQRIWSHYLPYTIVDVGYWHQLSWPRLSSGRIDQWVLKPSSDVYHDGDAPNLLTDLRDIGRFVARILKDDRTLNQKVFTYSDVLSQNQITAIMEEKSGEKVEFNQISKDEAFERLRKIKAAHAADPTDPAKNMFLWGIEYDISKYIRRDNTPEHAKYLGYLDARELYPDFKPISFGEAVDELLAGGLRSLYPEKREQIAQILGSQKSDNKGSWLNKE